MRSSTNQRIKSESIKFDDQIVLNSTLGYLRCTKEQIASVAVSGKLRHARCILFYMMYMHTTKSYKNIQEMIFITLPKMRMWCDSARIQMGKKGGLVQEDINNLLTIIKQQSWNKI